MPHLSKQKMDHAVLLKLYERLVNGLGNKNSPQSTLLQELLTNTEKIMLAKRLAIITMLIEGHGFEQIYETLKISPSTIARFSLGIENGKYDGIRKQLKKGENKKLIEWMLSLVAVGLRPIHAPRWEFLDTQ